MKQVNAWKEEVIIPTYAIGKPEKNPIFLEKRVYQGSSGEVYPYPVIEKITDKRSDKSYQALFIENRYLKIMVLPEIGGRIQMAYDKIKQRHFIYYNQVIKPALVGLTGPWISGGIEFNWPQHHRPSTFEPVDHSIEEHPDGSKTIWVNEIEIMFRTKGMAGFRLYPDKAYLEINVQLFNRTQFPQTFLWWANPAVKVNDAYQTVFPPDVNAVFDHGKRDVSEFPIAKGVYYNVDYSPGTDISRFSNIPVPTSYMAYKSDFNFMGGYENDTKGGLLHVANRHVSPGKKQWTWGCGEFGMTWYNHLTDEDGPYIELMTGVYTDNQPDFSWLQPNEVKDFRQYFMPYSDIGIVKNATRDASVNLEVCGSKVEIGCYATSDYKNATISLSHCNKVLFHDKIDIDPSNPYITTVEVSEKIDADSLRVSLRDQQNNPLVSYSAGDVIYPEIPESAKPAKEPKNIESIEQLYLTGLHLEQYRHATFRPLDYYMEALKREPGDNRCNNAVGLYFLRRGQFDQALPFFKKSIETLTERNPNPYDGEPFYNLGLCYRYNGDFELAVESLYKATWNAAWQDSGFLELGRIHVNRGQYNEALDLIHKSLLKNTVSPVANHLKVVILRLLGNFEEAVKQATGSLEQDQFNLNCLFELHLLTKEEKYLDKFGELSRMNVHTICEYSWDYSHAGRYSEAKKLLDIAMKENPDYPMTRYYSGYFSYAAGKSHEGYSLYEKAEDANPDYCFPNRIEDVKVLEHVIKQNKNFKKAPCYLGTYWYAKRNYKEAIQNWEHSARLDDTYPVPFRNLGLAYFNKEKESAKSLKAMEKAFSINPGDARILMELDQLYKTLNKPLDFRLKNLESYPDLTNDRDDLYLERISLYNALGKYKTAQKLLQGRRFHPWEGGEGKVVYQYVTCHEELGKQDLIEGNFDEALTMFGAASRYPKNLGEGKLYGTQENNIDFWMGYAHYMRNDVESARLCFQKASSGNKQPRFAFYYNDPQPDKIVYQGLALAWLGDIDAAGQIFDKLINFGKEHLEKELKIDYFAVSMPDLQVFEQDLSIINKVHCHYMIGLGMTGKGKSFKKEAKYHFDEVLKLQNSHLGAIIHKKLINHDLMTTSRKTLSI